MAGDAVGGHECICFITQHIADLSRHPNKELALFSLAVGVLGGVEAAGRIGHLADDIVEALLGYGAEEFVAGDRLNSSRIQDPGVEVDVCLTAVCLTAPSSWELS